MFLSKEVLCKPSLHVIRSRIPTSTSINRNTCKQCSGSGSTWIQTSLVSGSRSTINNIRSRYSSSTSPNFKISNNCCKSSKWRTLTEDFEVYDHSIYVSIPISTTYFTEIPDFQLEDPDPPLLILDPEHWNNNRLKLLLSMPTFDWNIQHWHHDS